MANPADLAPSAVRIPPPELREGTVFDDATEPRQLIRCVIPTHDSRLATDPLSWKVLVEPGVGYFYPKKDDRVVIGKAPDGAPFILEWWPTATAPDVPLP